MDNEYIKYVAGKKRSLQTNMAGTNNSSYNVVYVTDQVQTETYSDIDRLHYIGHGFIVPSICAVGCVCNILVIVVLVSGKLAQVQVLIFSFSKFYAATKGPSDNFLTYPKIFLLWWNWNIQWYRSDAFRNIFLNY